MFSKKLLLFSLFCLGALGANSQSLTGSYTQQPCNDDGVYTVNATGMSLPITYTYHVNGETFVHSNVNSSTDQLTGIWMYNNSSMYVVATSGSATATCHTSFSSPFVFYSYSTSPFCPATIGSVEVIQQSGPSANYSFEWTNMQTQQQFTGNPASVPLGDYTGIVTNPTTGCKLHIGDTNLHVYQQSDIAATFSNTPASCTNGTSTVNPSGGTAPYTFLWENGATSQTITGLPKGQIGIKITDAQGCYTTGLTTNITQNPNITVNHSSTDATCTNNDGEIIAFGQGGVQPYTYQWSNGQNTQTATNLVGDQFYQVHVTDANGCTGFKNIYLDVSTPITVSISSTPSSCTSPTGSATVSSQGGIAPYTTVWNTSPVSTGPILNNVGPGWYSFKVTDASGCVRTGSVYVNPTSTINASTSGTQAVCPSNTGTVSASASGSNPPFTYLWNTGATTSTLSNVPSGSYTCTITDAAGCSVSKIAAIKVVSPINIGMNVTPVSCKYSSDGGATAVATGGQAPYTYSYSTGATSASVSNLMMGGYTVTVTDANGCTASKYFLVSNAQTNNDCFCTITGTVFEDINADCILDSGEPGVENVGVHVTNMGYVYTNANGQYAFQVPSGTYTVSENIEQTYPLAPCQTNGTTITVNAGPGCVQTVNFANVINPLHDLKIITMNSTIPPVPGNSYSQRVIMKNMGTIAESTVNLGYEQDQQLIYTTSSSPLFMQQHPATSPYNYGISTGFPTLNPAEQSTVVIDYLTPTNIPINTELVFHDSVAQYAPIESGWLDDNSPWNNVNAYKPVVVSSYDPNYKEVTPKGFGSNGAIPFSVKEFDYVIHFQNEGTYYAQNIVVTDQLDDDFDWTTFKPGYSEYEYTAEVSESGLVTFTFANINLPWKDQFGDELSSSMVHYSIKRKPNLPEGTEFTNTAYIYFDYNAPIITNTTLNTLEQNASLEENEDGLTESIERSLDLYPVPTSDILHIRLNNIRQNETAQLSIISITGTEVISTQVDLNEGTTVLMQPVTDLSPGTYLTRVVFEDGSSLIKRMVVR
ncbi:MAG: hypothetical protein N4A41_02330 [Crocinitomicaceae bacterium]|jgi:hypothetical protein|nr:hypothetical protein [Crocinitomicaceae bacterium]